MQEEPVEEADVSEKEERDGKRLRAEEEGELSEQEEKEEQEAKRIRIDEGEISDIELSRALRSTSSSSLQFSELEPEADSALSLSKKSATVADSINNTEMHGRDSRQFPWRIDTGIFRNIPPELLYHILKYLSSEVSRCINYFQIFFQDESVLFLNLLIVLLLNLF